MYVCKFVRRIFLSLPIIAALVGFSLAQDTTSTARPSQADCLAAANSGSTMPASCTQEDSLQRNIHAPATRFSAEYYADAGPDAAVDDGAAGGSGAGDVAPLNPSERKKVELPVHPHTEFEQIVADTIGRPLPLFGQTLFAQPPSTFAATTTGYRFRAIT